LTADGRCGRAPARAHPTRQLGLSDDRVRSRHEAAVRPREAGGRELPGARTRAAAQGGHGPM